MLSTILHRLGFRCRHREYSRVFTERIGKAYTGRKYVVCLRCGKNMEYDWAAMKVIGPLNRPEQLTGCPVEEARRAL